MAAAAEAGSSNGLVAALPKLQPWAEARVASWATGWEKAAALTPNPPIPVLDLMPAKVAQVPSKPGPFETKFGAFIYDKGYRQLFRALGYPGPDAEAALALDRLSILENGGGGVSGGAGPGGGVFLDLSCGPGIITSRLAAKLTGYDTLVASDVSEAMTRRAAEQLDRIGAAASSSNSSNASNASVRFAAVRADVGELPFADGSIAAAHSSAGAHCWPDAARGFAEVARVLRPRGAFVMSTVVLAGPIRDKYVEGGRAADAREYDDEVRGVNTPFWDAAAVVGMLESAGLVEVEVVKEDKCFVMLVARKP